MEKLNGPFKDIIPTFQKYKKSLGYKYDNINQFYKLDKFLEKNNIHDINDSKNIYDVAVTSIEDVKTKINNYKILCNLYEFLERLGYKDLYLEKLHFKREIEFVPYILNNDEVTKLFDAIDRISNEYRKKGYWLYSVLFRLVYSCGLRISEALELNYGDYDKENGTILIKKSKNNITRLLPLSDTMNDIIKNYDNLINNPKRNFFFEQNNKPISYFNVSSFFKLVKMESKLPQLTIHSLRYNFCVHTIENMHNNGYDEKYILSILYIYMGHSNIESTLYYYKLTEHYYDKIFEKIENANMNVIPKVGDIYE